MPKKKPATGRHNEPCLNHDKILGIILIESSCSMLFNGGFYVRLVKALQEDPKMLSPRYRAAAPADAYHYGIGWTDLFAGATVDAIRGAGRQALTI